MIVVDIVSIVLYVFFGLAVLIGALVGLKRGLYRSGVKLLANIVRVALALFITKYVSGVAVRIGLNAEFVNRIFGIDNVRVFAGIASAIFAIFVFAFVFFIVRLLMLIPQHIICKKLPKKYAQAVGAVDPSASQTPVPAYKDKKNALYGLLRALWGTFAAAMGGVAALIVVGVYVFPLFCFTVHTAEPINKAMDLLPESFSIEELDFNVDLNGIKEGYNKVTSHPVLKTVDLMFGNTVYRPLLDVKLYEGKGNLDDTVCTVLGFASDVTPTVLDIMDKKPLSDERISEVKSGLESLSEDNITVTITALGMNLVAEPFNKEITNLVAQGSQLTPREEELFRAIKDIFDEATAKTVSDDIHAVAEMLDSLKGSNIFNMLANDDKTSLTELSSDKLFAEETLGNLFGVAYDASGVRRVIIPMVNLCFEGVFEKAGVEPVYTEKKIDEITREEFVEEGKRLSVAFGAIAKFIESAGAENADVSSFDLSAIGKALDCLRQSILFGDKYSILMDSFSEIIKKETADEKVGEILDIVNKAVAGSDSAEKVLASTKDMIVFADELKKGEKKGSENEKIVSALDNLKNLDSENDREAVNSITEEVINSVMSGDEDSKKAMMTDSVNAITEVLEEGTYDSKKEADAIQKLYDVANSEDKDEVTGQEKEITESVLDSQIADKLINNLNEKDENYGIADSLTEENKKNFLDAINESDADAAKKEALKKFLGLN
jgi:hypothetical protein